VPEKVGNILSGRDFSGNRCDLFPVQKTMKPSILGRRVTRPLIMVTLASGSLALMTGCGSYPEEHVVSSPPPPVATAPTQQVIVTQPTATGTVTATPLGNGQLLVTQAPPTAPQATVVATRPPRPSDDYVWIEGYWAWRNDRYEWVESHWQQPPRSNAVWVAPRWERRSDGKYTFYEGYWD
jgi:hypothetical protein